MMFSRWNVRLAGLCALAATLLAATSGGAIGKAERPRPKDLPMAMDEPSPQSDRVEKGDRADKRSALEPESRAVSEPQPTVGELIAAEERKHLKRMARINRIQALGVETADQSLVDLARELRQKETERHALAMKRLEPNLSAGGGR